MSKPLSKTGGDPNGQLATPRQCEHGVSRGRQRYHEGCACAGDPTDCYVLCVSCDAEGIDTAVMLAAQRDRDIPDGLAGVIEGATPIARQPVNRLVCDAAGCDETASEHCHRCRRIVCRGHLFLFVNSNLALCPDCEDARITSLELLGRATQVKARLHNPRTEGDLEVLCPICGRLSSYRVYAPLGETLTTTCACGSRFTVDTPKVICEVKP